MTHLAFDLGLNCTGVAWPGGTDTYHYKPPTPITPQAEHNRLEWWQHTFRTILLPWPDATVVVEAPFIHPTHISGAMNLVLLHGVLRSVAIDGKHDYVTVTPAELKKWATGRGNANKDRMLAAARARGWEGDDHNEADAFLLWTMWAER